jgi:hypothetical protein
MVDAISTVVIMTTVLIFGLLIFPIKNTGTSTYRYAGVPVSR